MKNSEPELGLIAEVLWPGAASATMKEAGCRDRGFMKMPLRGALELLSNRGYGISKNSLAHLPTAPRARTGLFVPDLSLLVVAAPHAAALPAAVLLFRAKP